MSVVAFDTLKFAERLEAGGFTPQQAKAASQAFADATGEQLATKADLDAVRIALKSDLDAVKIALKSDIDGVRTELRAEIKSAVADAKTDIVRWLIVSQIGLAGFIFAAIKFVH